MTLTHICSAIAFAMLAFALGGGPPALARAPDIEIVKEPGAIEGDPVAVRVRGVEPGRLVEIVAERTVGRDGALHRSLAVFSADAAGIVDTARDAPVSGDYQGTDVFGLFWSMTPDEAAPVPESGITTIRVLVDGEESALHSFQLSPYADGLLTRLAEPFPGSVFVTPPGPGPFPAIIVLGGSEGGSSTARDIAPRFASKGYAVLGLPYYSPNWGGGREIEALPEAFADLSVDRLEEAHRWLAAQDSVDAARIGVWGVSKGAEFALLAAAAFGWIDAVAAIVPTDLVWEGWGPGVAAGERSGFSLRGESLPFMPYGDADLYFGAFARGERPAITLTEAHRRGRERNPDREAAARIRVERIRAALLVAGGGEDTIWPSADMARAIAEARAANGLPTTTLIYAEAGHGLGGPGATPTASFGSGGSQAANGRARAEVWLATLSHFETALDGD